MEDAELLHGSTNRYFKAPRKQKAAIVPAGLSGEDDLFA
jgi:hypothetical protein